MHKSISNPNNNYINIANEILEWTLTIDPNLILSEQYDLSSMESLSADKLTWNYSELYHLYNMLN
jgi:GH15 family glucan-1,4-alpha-glucosidase